MARLRSPRILSAALAGLLALFGAAWATQLFAEGSVPPHIHDLPGDRKPLPCPDNALVIVLFGQSLSANSGTRLFRPASEPTVPPAYNYFAGHCYPLRDPMLGAAGDGGSIGTPMAGYVSAALRRPVVLIAGGIGGTSIVQWTARDSAMRDLLLDRIADARRAGLRPAIHVWVQGEADVAMPAASYANELGRLHARMPAAPWIVTSNSVCPPSARRSASLDQARSAFASRTPGIHLGVDMDALGPAFRQADGCHLNGDGQERVARMIASAVVQALGG
ncbi:hypothetical protein SAMN06295912_11012 [Sphingomonas laterariae]|uniref:Sialate O-acetylesterase domain-containing protein n=1 Tax=Edaphosphingomonas laterariae TaxID=861865 RepID=A0A239FRG1_9SPHN|nr:sialate O-acetylesterase [Sphingomonas laterariae]SNS59557.1 hypothetical protein SAMN06295912_11012 [Sphingomonas laterariae]